MINIFINNYYQLPLYNIKIFYSTLHMANWLMQYIHAASYSLIDFELQRLK